MDDYSTEEVDQITIASAGKPGKGILSRLMIPLIVLFLALAGFGTWWFFLRGESEAEVIDVAIPEQKEAEPPKFGLVYRIPDIILNPSGGRRHFLVSVSLEYFDPTVESLISEREVLLRDNLITLFSSQPAEVLTNVKYRQALRARVKKIMDYQIGEGKVTRVFFDKWVFQ